jgi:hypothetical protein
MASQPPAEDLRHEVQATLAARRELGPEYDEHFIATLTDRIVQRARLEVQRTPAPHQGLSPEMRVAVAICSLIFGIPLVAISAGIASLPGLIVVCLMIVGVNFAASR